MSNIINVLLSEPIFVCGAFLSLLVHFICSILNFCKDRDCTFTDCEDCDATCLEEGYVNINGKEVKRSDLHKMG